MSDRLRLFAAGAASLVLVAVGASACGSDSPESGTDPVPANAPAASTGASDPRALELAADWLVGNLNADGLLENTSAYEGKTATSVDVGSSIDLVLGLSASGLLAQEATAVTDAVAEGLPAYVGSGGEVYSGASAKALRLAVDQGRDPHDFGGLDLQARVEDRVATKSRIAGRLQDRSEFGDYANSIGQSYAAAALSAVGSERAESVTDFLLAQQCEEGFFRLAFAAKGAAEQGCDADDSLPAEQAPDTTALVAVQLAPLAEDDEQVQDALTAATKWLLAQQADDGSFADPENGTNSNTTGLAGWALLELGEDDAAARAAGWVRDLQVAQEGDGSGEESLGKLAGETGALAYDEASLAEGREYGLADPLDRSPWVVAGVQAFPVLAAAPAAGESE
ncbi:hypothetical protein [Nocardioides houyundeii]|uniref:hypothetical protein n=1 Tax=Nocardioides houyundeii TaxID=2045452 RepID=UPI000C793EA4|nr:hypothetical protein [Nocardioides houyundeii]